MDEAVGLRDGGLDGGKDLRAVAPISPLPDLRGASRVRHTPGSDGLRGSFQTVGSVTPGLLRPGRVQVLQINARLPAEELQDLAFQCAIAKRVAGQVGEIDAATPSRSLARNSLSMRALDAVAFATELVRARNAWGELWRPNVPPRLSGHGAAISVTGITQVLCEISTTHAKASRAVNHISGLSFFYP